MGTFRAPRGGRWVWGIIFGAMLFAGIAHAGHTVTIGLWPGHPSEQKERIFAPVVDSMGRITGIDFELRSLSHREAGLAAFRSGQVDLLLTGPREYLAVKARIGARPLVAFSDTDHYAVVAVRGDLGITRASHLKKQAVIMTPGHLIAEDLAPLHLILQMGLNPFEDVSTVRLDPESGWRSFRSGTMTVMATSFGNLARLMDRDRDFSRRAVRILGRGPDLPGDILLIRPHWKPAVASRIRDAFRSHAAVLDALLRAGMGGPHYRNTAFTTNVTDQDYQGLLAMMAEVGQRRYAGLSGKYD